MPIYRVRVRLELSDDVRSTLEEWKISVQGPTGVGDSLVAVVLAGSEADAERMVDEALARWGDVPVESLGQTR